MKYIFTAIAATISCIFTINAFAQNNDRAIVSGTVYSTDKQPAAFVSVYLQGTSYGTISDERGQYSFAAPAGKYVIGTSSIEYKTQNQPVTLSLRQKVSIDFILEESNNNLEGVEVYGKSKIRELREQAYNITAIDTKQLRNSSSDINQVLNRTTGVRVRESGGMGSHFNFSLNGFSGDQVKIFLDGVPIDNYGSSFTLNNIPVNMAERIEVYKGVVPIELGADALGGAVNIVTNKKINKFIDASYSYGSFNTSKASVNARYTTAKGITTNVSAFLNYSDNSYKVDVSVADKSSGKFMPEQKYPHFHDGYKSGTVMLEAGLKDKKYADYLLLGMMVSGNEKDIQQGATMQRVAGQAYTDSRSFIPSLKYRKEDLLVDGLSLGVSSSYSLVHSSSVDTSSRVYNWTGNYTFRNYVDYGTHDKGELGDKTIYVYDEQTFLTITNLQYDLSEYHTFSFNYSYSNYMRDEDDLYRKITRPGKPAIIKNIMGVGYKLNAFDKKLALSVFGKMFGLDTKMNNGDSILMSNSRNYGYGAASTYHIIPGLQAKASFEHTYRLPTANEMLGDGLNILSNPLLRPENSDNLNLGVSFAKRRRDHYWGVEGNFIYRNARDFIQNVATGVVSIYENQNNIQVTGFDGVIRYEYKEWLLFEVNGTWQESINTNRFAPPGSEIPNFLYGVQMPNTPILFGNADIRFNFTDLVLKRDKLSFHIGCNYIDAYYLTWPTLGDPKYKRAIPEQFTQDAGLTYSLQNGRYNITFNCRNITDVKVYDYFNVQKPGRSFAVNLRYSFSK